MYSILLQTMYYVAFMFIVQFSIFQMLHKQWTYIDRVSIFTNIMFYFYVANSLFVFGGVLHK